ncbi:MAG: hypothetical protein WBO00_00385, partial [Steroidobacteraceae bacterium]
GGTLIRRGDAERFIRGDITVLIGPDTIVTRDGGGHNLLRPGAISVGQRIIALGDASADDDNLTLDATAGRVRLKLTHLAGSVVSALPGLVTLDLFSIDGRRPVAFDFTGTGTSSATDADPDNYEVGAGAFNSQLLMPGDPARVFGFVTPFGFAPPDFVGRTLVDFTGVRADMAVGWGADGTSAPFLSMGTDGLVVDNANPDLGARHHIKIGPLVVDITALASAPTVAPAAGPRLFAIGRGNVIEVFGDWNAFTARLEELLGGGAKARGLFAHGHYERADNTLTANYVAVVVVE